MTSLSMLAVLAACSASPVAGPDPATASEPVVSKIQVRPQSAALVKKDELSLKVQALDASGNPIPNATIQWSVADTTIATVSDGMASGKKEGTTTLTAQSGSQKGQVKVHVQTTGTTLGLSVIPDADTLSPGGSVKLSAEVTDKAGNPVPDAKVSWSSADASVASVDGDGAVTAVAAGQTRITAKSKAVTADALITVTGGGSSDPPPASGTTVDPFRAFPDAQGWGAEALTQCSRQGMQVLHVSSLGDDGPGTLRDAISRTDDNVLTVIVFDVGGYITLSSRIVMNRSCLYVAGQTAPGDGITIRAPDNQAIFFKGAPVHDVVFRYLRFRNGTYQPGTNTGGQGMIIGSGERVTLDHVSFSWGSDQLLSIYKYPFDNWGAVREISVQRSLFAEPLHSSPVCYTTKGREEPEADGVPSWYKVTHVTFHHNVAIDCDHRAPENTARDVEVINNVVYNWHMVPMDVTYKTYVDFVANYFKAGPKNYGLDVPYGHEIGHQFRFDKPGGLRGTNPDGYVVIGNTDNIDSRCGFGVYLQGNIGPHNPDGSHDQWTMTSKYGPDYKDPDGPYPEAYDFYTDIQYSNSQNLNLPVSVNGCQFRRSSRLEQPSIPVQSQSASSAWQALVVNGDVGDNRGLTCGGDWTSTTDAVDERVLRQAIQGTGPGQGQNPSSQDDVGGFPALSSGTSCADSDGDGMPDKFEARYGLDSHSVADASADPDGDGYSNLEEYLNGTSPR